MPILKTEGLRSQNVVCFVMLYSFDHSQHGASIHSFETSKCLLFLFSLSSDFLSFPSFPPLPCVSLAPLLPPALHLGHPPPTLPHHLPFFFSPLLPSLPLTGLVLPPPLLLPRPLVTSAPPPTSCTTTPGKYFLQYSN